MLIFARMQDDRYRRRSPMLGWNPRIFRLFLVLSRLFVRSLSLAHPRHLMHLKIFHSTAEQSRNSARQSGWGADDERDDTTERNGGGWKKYVQKKQEKEGRKGGKNVENSKWFWFLLYGEMPARVHGTLSSSTVVAARRECFFIPSLCHHSRWCTTGARMGATKSTQKREEIIRLCAGAMDALVKVEKAVWKFNVFKNILICPLWWLAHKIMNDEVIKHFRPALNSSHFVGRLWEWKFCRTTTKKSLEFSTPNESCQQQQTWTLSQGAQCDKNICTRNE